MNDILSILALIVGAGLVGGCMVVALTRGLRTVFGCLLWLALPFAVIAFLLAAQGDPTLPAERQSYNFSFGFVLISLIVAVPWVFANLVGGLFGLLFRRSAPAARAVPVEDFVVDPEDHGGLPDWSRADNPPLSLPELAELMHAAAELAGIAPARLPGIGPIAGGEGEFIDRDKFDYIYLGVERGQPMFDRRSAIADQLLYWIFVDQALMLASNRIAEQKRAGRSIPDSDYVGALANEQQAILGDIDPAWERQFAHERAQRKETPRP